MAGTSASSDGACETPHKKVRFCGNEEDDSQQIGTGNYNANESNDSNVKFQKIPEYINQWTEQHIQSLKIDISYEENVTPVELLEMFQPLYLTNNIICHELTNIENAFTNSKLFLNLLNEDFPSVKVADAEKLRDKNEYKIDLQSIKDLRPEVHAWFQRFTECGKTFGELLYNMVLKKQLADTYESLLCEYDFQFLFQDFTSMFGLQSRWSEPLLQPQILQMSRAKVTGKADILFCQEIEFNPCISLEQHIHIVSVCKVEKRFVKTEEHSCRTAGHLKSCTSTSTGMPPHLSPSLLGQHGGDLLMYYPQSFKKDVIFGMIIQGTKVTFTALKMTKQQYNGILFGKKTRTSPQLIVTKAYDFLKKEDRNFLIRPLLELSMMQKHDWTKM